MKRVHQTLFGGPNGDRSQIGNCYPSCIASLLDLDLADVPHVYQLHPTDDEAAMQEMLDWLRTRGLSSMSFGWSDWVQRYMHGSLCVISGKSPRGGFNHAVVGEITREGWRLVHDPHPSGAGIVGEPTDVEFLLPLWGMAA